MMARKKRHSPPDKQMQRERNRLCNPVTLAYAQLDLARIGAQMRAKRAERMAA